MQEEERRVSEDKKDKKEKSEAQIEKKEEQIERKTEGMVPEREYRAVVQVFIIFHPSTIPHVPVQSLCHPHPIPSQDLELLLSHREEIEKIQNFVAELQSAGLQGRVL